MCVGLCVPFSFCDAVAGYGFAQVFMPWWVVLITALQFAKKDFGSSSSLLCAAYFCESVNLCLKQFL